jgi:hypothetical protein
MTERIQDGKGRGYEAAVDSNNNLHTFAINRGEIMEVSIRDGESYNFGSNGYVDIGVTDTEYGMLYVKNTNASKNLHIESIRTCGTTAQKWRMYKDVTAGTLVSNQTAGLNQNINLVSANTASATVYAGSGTVTDGTMIEHWINDAGHSDIEYKGALILGTNDTVALSVEMPASGDVCCRIQGYYE